MIDYRQGRWIAHRYGPAYELVGMLEEDGYIRHEGKTVFRLEGISVYNPDGHHLADLDAGGIALCATGMLLFKLEPVAPLPEPSPPENEREGSAPQLAELSAAAGVPKGR